MGWRFHRSFKVIPGLRLNVSKRGLSTSIGGAPFTLNVRPRGVTGTASLPGTGLSYRHQFSSGRRPMARRKNASVGVFIGATVIICVLGIARTAADAAGSAILVAAIALLILAGVIWLKRMRRQKRIESLLDKYGNELVVERIMSRNFWEGQTAQQLIDSIGPPLSIDKKAMATRKREVWKYNRHGSNRYGLRITLDDDVVIGWDQKNR